MVPPKALTVSPHRHFQDEQEAYEAAEAHALELAELEEQERAEQEALERAEEEAHARSLRDYSHSQPIVRSVPTLGSVSPSTRAASMRQQYGLYASPQARHQPQWQYGMNTPQRARPVYT